MYKNWRGKFKTEFIAGITTFFTMVYIVVVNPSILATDGTGLPFSGVLSATVLVCFLLTLMMGLYADLPFAVAPGMGINAFFTFNIILGRHVPWPTALGMVFWAGVIFLIVSVTPVREAIAKVIPQSLRIAAAAGIGIFLTFIGLKNAGLVVADAVTFVRPGDFNLTVGLSLTGMIIMLILMARKSAFAFLGGIATVTIAAWLLGLIAKPPSFLMKPDLTGTVFKLDIWGALKPQYFGAIVSILFTDLFDSISTFVGVAYANNMLVNGEPKNLRQGLIVDAFATLGAGLLGTSSGTAYIESSAGIEAGGRTGLTSVVTAFCFLPFLFLAPVAAMVPAYATAPVLIIVGALMFKSIENLKFKDLEDLIPAFLTVVLIPLTFSITQGLLWGLIAHVGMYALKGRRKEIHPALIFIALLSAALLWLEHGPAPISK